MNEEERAALWRANRQARGQAEQSRVLGLAGDAGVRARLDAAWLPFYLASLEAQQPDEGEGLLESPQVA